MTRDIDDLRHPERCPRCLSDRRTLTVLGCCDRRHPWHDTPRPEVCPTCGWPTDRGIPETEECDGQAVCPSCERMRNVYFADEGTSGFVPYDDLMAEGYREAAATNGFQDVTFDSHNLSASDGLRTRDETPATALPAEVEEAMYYADATLSSCDWLGMGGVCRYKRGSGAACPVRAEDTEYSRDQQDWSLCDCGEYRVNRDASPNITRDELRALRSHIGWQNATIGSLQALSEWTAEKQERLSSLTEEVERHRAWLIRNNSFDAFEEWSGEDFRLAECHCDELRTEVERLRVKDAHDQHDAFCDLRDSRDQYKARMEWLAEMCADVFCDRHNHGWVKAEPWLAASLEAVKDPS